MQRLDCKVSDIFTYANVVVAQLQLPVFLSQTCFDSCEMNCSVVHVYFYSVASFADIEA